MALRHKPFLVDEQDGLFGEACGFAHTFMGILSDLVFLHKLNFYFWMTVSRRQNCTRYKIGHLLFISIT